MLPAALPQSTSIRYAVAPPRLTSRLAAAVIYFYQENISATWASMALHQSQF